jgi:2-polyprenyl-3-methyl-5-hydroxy-6-metoxy-1,4-benzoquinol methylase
MKSRTARDFFSDYAADFDAIYGTKRGPFGRFVDHTLRASMRLRFEQTMARCTPIEDAQVIDIGCGPGHFSVALAHAGAQRVIGLDVSDQMLEIARAHAETQDVSGKIDWVEGDASVYRPETDMDFTIVMGVMDYIKDPAPFIRHLISYTKGRLLFSFPASEGLLATQRKFRYRNKTPLYLYSHEQLVGLFEGIAPGQTSIEKLARDYFVEVTIS